MGKNILSRNLVPVKFDRFSTTYKKIGDVLFFVWFLASLKAGYLMLPENNTVPYIDYNVGYNVMLHKYFMYTCVYMYVCSYPGDCDLFQFLKINSYHVVVMLPDNC